MSTSKDTWVLGAGPFQQGTIFKETQFAGQPLTFPHFTGKADSESDTTAAGVPVTEAASWTEAYSGPMSLTQPANLPNLIPAGGPPRIGPTDQLVLDLVGGGAASVPAPVSPGSLPVASDPPAPAKPAAPQGKSSSPAAAAPNSGGQEETQPNRIFSSGFGSLPGAASDTGTSHAGSGSGGKKKPPGA